jgi:hypothetical protein
MIEIFKYNNKWRIKIVNETLQFNDEDDFCETLSDLINIKTEFQPHNLK